MKLRKSETCFKLVAELWLVRRRSRIANIKSWKSRENLSKNRSSNLRILWRTVCCWWPTSLWWLLNAEWASDHSDDCTPTLWQDGDLDLDSPVALWPALLLVLQRLQQTAPVQDGRVDAHVVHEGEGGVQAHVGLVHPVLPPPLLLTHLLLIVAPILPCCGLCQVEPLCRQGSENNKSVEVTFDICADPTGTSPPSSAQKTFLASFLQSAGWLMMCTARLCWSTCKKEFRRWQSTYILTTHVLFGLAGPGSPPAGAESLLAVVLAARLAAVREVGVPARLSRSSRSSWGVAERWRTPGLPLRTLRSSPRWWRLSLVSGPLAVEDIELVMPSKKSLEAGSLVGDPGARERGAGVESWGAWWGELWWGRLWEELVVRVDWDNCFECRIGGLGKLSTVVDSCFEWRIVELDKLSCTGIDNTFISLSDAFFWRTLIIEFFSATVDSSDLSLRSMSLTFLWLCCMSACIFSFSVRASDNFFSASAPVFSRIAILASFGMDAASMATCRIADSSR